MPISRRRIAQDYYDSLIYRTNPRSPRNRMQLLELGICRGDLIRLAAVAAHLAQPHVRRARDD